MTYTKKARKFSYSKLNTFISCGWKYKLCYVDKHFIFSDSLASELGSTVHHIEESVARAIKDHDPIDYEKLKDEFLNINIPKKDQFDTEGGTFGINILKEKYKEEFYKIDDSGQSYYTKTLDYLSHGIYRLENYLKEHPELEIYDMEKAFSIDCHGEVLSGFIDRIFYNKDTGEYIIEDIKTKSHPFKDDDLITPLQFVIYALAMKSVTGVDDSKIICRYDLPFCDMKQDAGTKGFIKRGETKIAKSLVSIDNSEFIPAPTPLCAWCQFSPTNPDQPEAGKNLCPYYSLWTRENKTHEVANEWKGMEKHLEIMQKEIDKNTAKQNNGSDKFDFDF